MENEIIKYLILCLYTVFREWCEGKKLLVIKYLLGILCLGMLIILFNFYIYYVFSSFFVNEEIDIFV